MPKKHGRVHWRSVFATNSKAEGQDEKIDTGLFDTKEVHICEHKIAQPTVFIPVFPGTNCEYDSKRAFETSRSKNNRKSIPQYECFRYCRFCRCI